MLAPVIWHHFGWVSGAFGFASDAFNAAAAVMRRMRRSNGP